MWSSKTEMVDEPIDDEDEEKPEVRRFDEFYFQYILMFLITSTVRFNHSLSFAAFSKGEGG